MLVAVGISHIDKPLTDKRFEDMNHNSGTGASSLEGVSLPEISLNECNIRR